MLLRALFNTRWSSADEFYESELTDSRTNGADTSLSVYQVPAECPSRDWRLMLLQHHAHCANKFPKRLVAIDLSHYYFGPHRADPLDTVFSGIRTAHHELLIADEKRARRIARAVMDDVAARGRDAVVLRVPQSKILRVLGEVRDDSEWIRFFEEGANGPDWLAKLDAKLPR